MIDASVARAASETQKPTSSACRNVLRAILEICHCVVLTEDIKKEWQRHASGYSVRWLAAMKARKKMRVVNAYDNTLREILDQQEALVDDGTAILSIDEIRAIRKDVLLVEASLDDSADRIVLSLDDRMQRLLSAVSRICPVLASIHWTNPTCQAQDTLEWLKEGAPDRPLLKLSFKELDPATERPG